MSNVHRSASGLGLAALSLCAGLAVASCNSSNAQQDARDRATAESCDWYQNMCDQIGPGKKYATRDACEVDVRAGWEKAWPPEVCDNKINESQLEICLTAIHSTQCMNGLDILNTIVNKCAQAMICSGGASNPDGG